jgi:protein-disulfide isomerase
MENSTSAQNPQIDRDARKAEQAKQDRRRARKAKLMPMLRLGGIALVIVAVIAGLIWIGESQDGSTPQPSPISGDVSSVDHVQGSETASLTLFEYADFQCPTCKAYAPVLEELLGQYPDDLRIVYRYFPLQSIHPNATISSQAAEAASLQGKFWEMHDLLFERQSDWSRLTNPRDVFTTYAEELGLNTEQFRTDLDSKEVKNRVNADYRSGLSAGVQGTPSFFLNGEPLENPRGIEAFQAIIEEQLQ